LLFYEDDDGAMNKEKRLHIVTVRLEFQYPVLADSEAAAASESLIREAMNDLGQVPWKVSVDNAGPEYKPPAKYDDRCLVYQADHDGRSVHHTDVTWAEAVKVDRMYAAMYAARGAT